MINLVEPVTHGSDQEDAKVESGIDWREFNEDEAEDNAEIEHNGQKRQRLEDGSKRIDRKAAAHGPRKNPGGPRSPSVGTVSARSISTKTT
jgi:hypothetical protein